MRLYPGLYFTELKYFVEMGVSPMETIMAATRSNPSTSSASPRSSSLAARSTGFRVIR